MKYHIKTDYIITAYQITEIRGVDGNGNYQLTLENGDLVEAPKDMTARMQPLTGDYWVISPDGYVYLNPKAVFEAKHELIIEATAPTGELREQPKREGIPYEPISEAEKRDAVGEASKAEASDKEAVKEIAAERDVAAENIQAAKAEEIAA